MRKDFWYLWNVEYYVFPMTARFTLTQSGSTCLDSISEWNRTFQSFTKDYYFKIELLELDINTWNNLTNKLLILKRIISVELQLLKPFHCV